MTSNPNDIYFFAISGVIAILLSIFLFSETEAIFSFLKAYNKNIAIKTKTIITATVPHNTNFVKLFQVFLWFSLSIKIIFVLL